MLRNLRNIVGSGIRFYSTGQCTNFFGKNIEIVNMELLSDFEGTEIHRMVLDAGLEWGADYGPGQFVMIRNEKGDERIPLTCTTYDYETGHLALVFQVAGASTFKLSKLKVGDTLEDLTYPLGTPLPIHPPEGDRNVAIVIAGGVGIAPAFAKTDALYQAGYDVKMLLGARNEELLILLDEMYESIGLKPGEPNDNVFICTDDGSYDGPDHVFFGEGDRSMFGVEVLNQMIDFEGKEMSAEKLSKVGGEIGGVFNSVDAGNVAEIFAVGPLMMMKSISDATVPMDIPTFASLNSIMIDGSGMCGGCKVLMDDEDFYVCRDGPTAPAHKLDWDGMGFDSRKYLSHEGLSKKFVELGEEEFLEMTVKDTLDENAEKNYITRLADRFDSNYEEATVGDMMDEMRVQFGHVAGYISLQEAVETCAYMCTCKPPKDDKKKKKKKKKKKMRPCQKMCPVQINIQEFISFLKPETMKKALGLKKDQDMTKILEQVQTSNEADPKFVEAVDKQIYRSFQEIKKSNPIPEITGLVCPQENQCQMNCISKFRKEIGPTRIGLLEAFVAQWVRLNESRIKSYDWFEPVKTSPPTGKKVMIVGSGPSGLVAGSELAKVGHEVVIYETLHDGGGVLMYGIPEFRLPKDIVQYEVEKITELGVKFELNRKISDLPKHMELYGFDAAFIGSGAGIPNNLYGPDGNLIPGQDLVGIYAANEFLTRTNLMTSYMFPLADTPPPDVVGKNVVVFGGGNVAMDSARCALRLGAKNTTIMYRRSGDEIPAREEEYIHAQEEGIDFVYLAAPLELIEGESGELVGIKYQMNELGEPDEGGKEVTDPDSRGDFRSGC